MVLNSLRLYRARPRALFGFVVVAAGPVAVVTAWMAAVVAAWTAAATADDVVVVAAAATDETDAMVVVVPSGGETVGGANGDVVVVFAASGRASEGEGRGGGGRGEGGGGFRTPLVVASCVAWRRAKRAALSVASLRTWGSGAESTPGAAAVALRTADVVPK